MCQVVSSTFSPPMEDVSLWRQSALFKARDLSVFFMNLSRPSTTNSQTAYLDTIENYKHVLYLKIT